MTNIPINIRPKDLMRINGLSYSRCAVIIRNCRKEFSKGKHQVLCIEELAEYLDISVCKLLENYRKSEV
ncbi:MAG: hypothetical protein LBS07_05455 [Prevotellaceae bacterium]|jgi:hypothetical protein|nr:hypothetical protein [Prevotellaceae bacterium]